MLNLTSALDNDYSQLLDINALGVSSVKMEIIQRERHNQEPVLIYNLIVTAIPAMDLYCDEANKANLNATYFEPRMTFLYLLIPQSVITIMQDKPDMDWFVSITAT